MAQSNVVELSKYELKRNITRAKTTLFYPGSQSVNRVSELEFKGGYIHSLAETYPETKVKNTYNYSYSKDKKIFTLRFAQFYNNKKLVDSTATFQLVKFQQLRFYYPKNQLKTQSRTYPKSLDITYNIAGEKYYTQLILRKDSTVSEINHFEDFKVQEFNQKGKITSQKFSEKYLNTYSYNAQGQLISDIFYGNLMKRSQDKPTKTRYFYENDARGNWVKKVTFTLDYKDKIDLNSFTTFETRELTYKDGFTSGSSDYDANFIQKKIANYK
jgi:hypothetical protein